MNFRSTGMAVCLLTVVIAGCGTVQAPGAGGHPTVPTTATRTTTPSSPTAPTTAATPSTAPSSPTATAGAGSSCQRPADDTLTLASNGKAYCLRVGEHVDLYLQGTVSRPWLEPLASSDVLVPVPNGATSLPEGLTGESFAAARPGQVLITSIRAPCRVTGKNEAEPAGSLPRVYPLGFCPSAGRFSVSIVVLR